MTSAIEFSRNASDALRNAIHATQPGDVPAPDTDQVLVELASMALDFHELLSRAGRNLDLRTDRIRLDPDGAARYPSAGTAVGVARLAIAEAMEASKALARNVDEARQVTATLGEQLSD